MEFKKHYEYCYNKTFAIGERKIKETLIKSKAKSLVYHLNYNIIKDTQNLLISKKSNIRLFDSLNDLNTIFANKFYSYTENNTELTLENNIYPEYLKINHDKLPPNYSFNKFLSDFGALKGLNDVVENFVNNPNLFKKMYDDNNFVDFKIPKNNLIKIETFEQKNDSENQSIEIIGDPKNNSINNSKEINEAKTLKFNISKFSEDEKIFLLHVNFYSTINFPLTEYSKLILITNGITDLTIFEKGSKNNRFYDKIFNGIEYYGTSAKREFINGVILKIEPFKLTNISKALNLIKSKI